MANNVRHGLLRVSKAIIPYKFRAHVRAYERRLIFLYGMSRIKRDPELLLDPRSSVLNKIIYGWGNRGWSASEDYLRACIELAFDAKDPILECGTGLSTILLGVITKHTGNRLWSLEHNPSYGQALQKYLSQHNLSSVRLHVKPLKSYGGYVWYDPPLAEMPERFSLVVCDGPPGSTAGGRYGLVPVMKQKFEAGTVLIVDDFARKEDKAIVSRWMMEYGLATELLIEHGTFAFLNIPKEWNRFGDCERLDI